MIKYTDLLEVFIISTIISLLSIPVFRVISMRTGYLDHPKDNKRHAHAMPLLGGVGIFLALFIGIMSQWDVIGTSSISNQVIAMLAGATALLILGLVDDKIGMGPDIKLLGQFVAAMIFYKSGFRVTFLGNYYLNLIFTYIWIIGMTNAFNLLDNMNGLSAGIAIIASFFFGVISWMNGQGMISIVSFCLCGSCLGFLRYNFPKAKIFMGDAGSLIIGFMLSTIAISGRWKTCAISVSMAVPLLILAYPIFDTTLVTVMRILERRSVFQGGKDHSSHRLALMGFRAKNTVLLVYLICFILGLCALIISRANFKVAITVVITAFISMVLLGVRLSLVDTGRFGRKKIIDSIEKE